MLRAMLCGLVACAVALASPAYAQTEAKPKAKRLPKQAPPSPEKAELTTARANFLFAARACEKPGRCDQELLRDAEGRFTKACTACAEKSTCEEEARAVRGGGGTRGFAPCK